MAPPSFTKITLQYPVFAASWDNSGRNLVVGGGGGAGRSGVSNKITVLRSSNADLTATADIELSRDEDSVTCLANLAAKDGLIVYAGINSSEKELLTGKNQHFRSFIVESSPTNEKTEKETNSGENKISLLSKSTLLTTPSSDKIRQEQYQRVIRLSHPRRSANGNKRIGAIASGLGGDSNEVVIFDATTSSPGSGDVIQRIMPPKGVEANDLDFCEEDDGSFKFAYCTDHEVYANGITYDFKTKKTTEKPIEPRPVYTVPHPDTLDKPTRAKIRSLRWISPQHILLLTNLPNKSGVEVLLLTLYSMTTIGSISQRYRLPRHVKSAVDFDVALLDADETTGERQIAIAVAGVDISLSVLTATYKGFSRNGFSTITSHTTLRDVHPLQITKIAWSPFFSPWSSISKDSAAKLKSPGPQYLRLASTSLGNTVVVDTFSLARTAKDRPSRYILEGTKSVLLYRSFTIFVTAVVLLVTLILVQSVLDIWGSGGGGGSVVIPDGLRRVLSNLRPPGQIADDIRAAGRVQVPDDITNPVAKVSYRLRDVLKHHEKHKKENKAIIVRGSPDSALSTEVHPDSEALLKEETELKRWEELTHSEKELWKKRLSNAGEWAIEQGETVLKGIFFGQYAGFVGEMARGAMGA